MVPLAGEPMTPMPQPIRRTNDRGVSEAEAPKFSKATARLGAGPRSDIHLELTPD